MTTGAMIMVDDYMSNGEWLASVPGTDHQKDQLLNCVGVPSLLKDLDLLQGTRTTAPTSTTAN